MKRNIIIIDDHKMFLDGLVSICEAEPHLDVILATSNPKAVLPFIEGSTEVHIVISDISMPEMDGIELNKAIKKRYPQIKTLIVSMHNNPKKFDALRKSGIDGYLQKNAPKAELLSTINKLLDGGTYFAEEVVNHYKSSMFTTQKAKDEQLSLREEEVLTLIAKEYTTQEIADQLYISKHTVETYRKNLMLKLDAKNLAGLTKHAVYLGLV